MRTLFAMVCACLASSATASATTKGGVSSSNEAPPPILSIPLVPHHVQRRRRLELVNDADRGEDRRRRRGRRHRFLDEDESDPLILADDKQSSAKTRRPSNDGNHMQIAHLFQGYGTHYADLWCGKPTPQRQTVIVDTGSGVTAFPCTGCNPDECGVPKYHLDALFDPSQSKTFHKLDCAECHRGTCDSSASECRIGMSYQEGSSWSAYEVVDTCYVGGLHGVAMSHDTSNSTAADSTKDDLDPFRAPAFAFPLSFGCQTKITGLFKTQLADGIMGMDRAEAAFWWQASDKLGLPRQFSLCFSRSPTASREGTDAGAMTIGGSDPRLHGSPMVYSSVTHGGGFYDVTIRQVYLREGGGESAAYDPQAKVVPLLSAQTSGIVDSGTTDTYFSRSMKSAFDAAFKQMVGQAYSHEDVRLTESELRSRPTILIQLAGAPSVNEKLVNGTDSGAAVVGLSGALDPDHPFDVIVAVPASHYYEYDEESDTYTARFYVEEGGGNVIGANSMMGHDVFFEVDNDRIGWSESPCDYPALVRPFLDSGDLVPVTDSSRQQEPGNTNEGTTPDEGEEPAAQKDESSGTDEEPDLGNDGSAEKDTAGDNDPSDENEEPESEGGNDISDGETSEETSSSHDTDKPSTDIKRPSSGTCSATCRFGAAASVLFAGVLLVLFLVRRRGSGRRRKRYFMAHNAELELGEISSTDSGEDDFHVQYRDRPSSDRRLQQYDAEEQETGILS